MSLKETVLKKSYSSYFILFILGLSYYSLYFLPVFLNLNNVLCNSIDDNLKNYFTFVYQVKHGKELLHFNGFNYPFGEHVVYTDCQPLLTFILHPLGFTHDYSIGILHFLMFFSILICPLVYLHIFKQIGIPKTAAFTTALAITILSPQLYRIYIGHYALAYACLIPLSAAGILNYLNNPQNKKLGLLFLFNCIIFLVHPYYGLGLSLFTFLSLCFYIPFHKKKYFLQLLNAILTGILPIILFRVFMHATDTHVGRSPDPLGNSDFISNMSSLLVPIYGPFNKFMEKLVGEGPPHFEGIAYLGVGLMILTCICILILPFYIKKIKFNKPVLCLFFASLFFLLFSFGFQYRLQEIFGIKLQALNQFRAMGRFSWFLYYVLPILIFSILVELAKQFKLKKSSYLLIGLSFVYLIFNLIEGGAYFKIRESEYWKDRNVFNPKTLTLEEKNLINRLNQGNTQGIIPLPTYYLGNEVYDRSSFTLPLFTSAIYSYHTGLPIVSACMSRTSVNETEYAIDLLNSYKRKRITDSLLNTKLFFVIKTREPLLEDEKRLWRVTKFYSKNDTTEFGFVSLKKIQQPNTGLQNTRNQKSNNVFFRYCWRNIHTT